MITAEGILAFDSSQVTIETTLLAELIRRGSQVISRKQNGQTPLHGPYKVHISSHRLLPMEILCHYIFSYCLEHDGRSPRWTTTITNSGSPRMLPLIVLVREFESRRGEILNLFAIFF